MQSKGAIRLVAILFALACIWQLSFTAVTRIQEKKAARYAAQKAEQFVQANNVAADVREYVLDSVANIRNRAYIDSISGEKVYLGYTYQSVKEKEINLGLDLKGGMNVMLQVQLEDLVKALSGGSSDPDFVAALTQAKKNNVNSSQDFIALFETAWAETANGRRLAEIFGTYELRDKVKPESTDKEVVDVIRGEAKSAIDNSFNVLRNRIDRFGVTQPNIQRIENSGKILIELPGVKDPERVRKLLQGTASLEFWPTFTANEVNLQAVDARVAEVLANLGDSTAVANPLFSVLSPSGWNNACIGFANGVDTATVNSYLALAEDVLPQGFRGLWTVKPSDFVQSGNVYELVAIKATSRDGKAPLDGGAVTDARVDFNGQNRGGSPSVSMTMNAEGASIWARLTKDNIGKQIAIVLDGLVYSYPNVQNEITGGNSQITGNFDVQEAEDLANVLKSGKLPAPATIIQEQVVGPSLGSASIRAGLISFVIAFLLVLIYMVFFYQGAGLIADVALLCNVLLLFGTLVSFGAVLTLPGIAGLVLTLGMAVDANVIIYERIKEEIAAGKGFGKAVADGYKNAYSAIIDGQLTTLLTGIILYIFGSGPVQGFATTLIIGIITSVLTSIFITRLIFDDRIQKGKTVSLSNKATENFLKHTKIDFVGAKKYSYIISGALIVIAIASITFKGFSYGVDFTGGRTYIVRFDQAVKAEEVRSAVENTFQVAAAEAGEEQFSVEVKQFGGDAQMKITTQYKVNTDDSAVDAEIEGLLYDALQPFYAEGIALADFTSTLENPNGIISSDKVGPTIARDIQRSAVISVLLALLGIFAYIAVRFKGWTWGLGGVVSLAHTAIIVIGFFSLFNGILPFNLDIDQTFIAAILTIIGYAINDNVVIFDRIREQRGLHPNADFRETVNTALNATLTRTVNTSVSTLLPMLAIAIFGGESIRGLAVALCLGIVIGTYASIMIGTPVMFDATAAAAKKKAAKK
ncbi:MAG: protein translocase subunit SecD [Bacteroidales bacterium]|nr:protein translocase subunit SecD [Bacteroidales bacterium]MBR1706938.1 protein translocase subunit SecD [Bacteroidales bacterium]